MENTPHKPVLIDEILRICHPIQGRWLDGTFGAGGYSRALIEAGAKEIIGIDRDPMAHEMASQWLADYGGKIELRQARFSEMNQFAEPLSLAGIVLDIGVSSMQLDIAERGFSFMKDGPLDMRMAQEGPSAADLVNSLEEGEIADILYQFGEERQSRRIARAIVVARKAAPLRRTSELASLVEAVLPRKKPHQPHPATRSFQALRIAVNQEFDELQQALLASIDLLKPAGFLVVVSFHSLEDRIVKQFMAQAAGKNQGFNRYQPVPENLQAPEIELVTKKPVIASEAELTANPRARSAKLRVAQKVGVAA